MTADVTVLGLAVDSRQVVTAGQALDQMAAAGKRAETAAQAVESASKQSASATQAVSAAYGRSAATAGAAASAGRLADDAYKRVGASSAAAARGVGLTAYQTQQLSFQLNDLFVQIASGASPLTALIQQGSQLSGTFGGVGGALRAVGSLITPFRVLVGGAATAVLALGAAIFKGAAQSDELSRSLLVTGNAAGVSRSEFERLKGSIADATGTTVGSARDVLQNLVSTGRFSGQALTATAIAAQLLGKATGQSTDEILKSFVGLTNGVASGAEQLNRTYHFLTAQQLDYIKTLEEQGQQQKAIKVTMEALGQRVQVAAGEVGILERAWNAAKSAVSGYVDAVLKIGRAPTAQEQLDSVSGQLAERLARGPLNTLTSKAFEKGNAALRQQQAELQEVVRMEQRQAEIGAKNAATEQAKIAFMKLQEQSLTKQQQLKRELDKANALADAAGASPEERKRLLASIREKFTPGMNKAELGADISSIRTELNSLTSAYAGAESILEAQRSAGIVSERAYYDAKRAFIRLDEEAQIRALTRENDELAKAKATSVERVENERRIAENRVKIEILRASAAAKTVVVDAQQAASLKQVEVAYLQARLAADAYITTLQRQQQRELDGIGLGNRERERLSARGQITDRFDAQREELERQRRTQELEGRFGDSEREQYSRRLALTDEYQAKALASWDDFYAKRTERERDFNVGVNEALANYVAESANTAKQVEQVFTRAFQGMEDALVQAVTTGKLDFKSLANSIIADLVRIEIRARLAAAAATFRSGGGLGDVLAAFVNASAGASGGGGTVSGGGGLQPSQGFQFGPGRASGGPVKRGVMYPVNENGPGELLNVGGRQYLMAGADGSVSKAGGRGAMNYSPSITVNVDSRTDQAAVREDVLSAVNESQQRFARELHRMGVL
jgi:lambda family phage tail tape measure protein